MTQQPSETPRTPFRQVKDDNDLEAVLIVGGPHAGDRIRVFAGEPAVRLFVRVEAPAGTLHASETSAPEACTYDRSKWRSAGRDGLKEWSVFKPAEWSDADVLDELLKNYRPQRP